MAGFYNPVYPQPQYFTQVPQNYQQQSYQQQQPVQQLQQPQIQNNGFISVPSEDVARNYPVGPGNSVTFKNENAPYVYTKTMGFSQLDRPIFEKYKLVREEDTLEQPVQQNPDEWKSKFNKELDDLKAEIETLRGDVDVLKEQKKPANRKKDDSTGGGD